MTSKRNLKKLILSVIFSLMSFVTLSVAAENDQHPKSLSSLSSSQQHDLAKESFTKENEQLKGKVGALEKDLNTQQQQITKYLTIAEKIKDPGSFIPYLVKQEEAIQHLNKENEQLKEQVGALTKNLNTQQQLITQYLATNKKQYLRLVPFGNEMIISIFAGTILAFYAYGSEPYSVILVWNICLIGSIYTFIKMCETLAMAFSTPVPVNSKDK